MTVEEKIGKLLLALVEEASYVSFGVEETVFHEKMYTFRLAKIKDNRTLTVTHKASMTQLEEMSDPFVVADAMKQSLRDVKQ